MATARRAVWSLAAWKFSSLTFAKLPNLLRYRLPQMPLSKSSWGLPSTDAVGCIRLAMAASTAVKKVPFCAASSFWRRALPWAPLVLAEAAPVLSSIIGPPEVWAIWLTTAQEPLGLNDLKGYAAPVGASPPAVPRDLEAEIVAMTRVPVR